MANLDKSARRQKIKKGLRKRINGTAERPRLAVFRSNKEIYCQLIDDVQAITIVGTSSRSKVLAGESGTKTDISRSVGREIARIAKEKGVEKVVFDRGGFQYHGRVKALAEGAREGGLIF
jgi:large subunit ribosomal protein L18